MKKERRTNRHNLQRHHIEEAWGNFYLSEDGWCFLAAAGNRSHAGLRFSPHSGWYTLDRENKQLGEEKFSLSLSLSLSTSSQRQSVRQRFSCVSLPSMNVIECECARAASRAHVKWSWGIVLAPGAEEQPPRGEDAKCVCACLCVYTDSDHWLRSYKDERVHCVEERIASVEGNSDSLVHIFVLTPEHHTRVSWQVNPGLSDVHASLTLREPRIDTYFLFSFYTHFKIAYMMPL